MKVNAKITTTRGSAFLIEVDLELNPGADPTHLLYAMLRDGVWHAERTFYPYHSIYKVEVLAIS